MFVLSSPYGCFSHINQEHFIAVITQNRVHAKAWKTRKGAENFLARWKGAGIGLKGFEVAPL